MLGTSHTIGRLICCVTLSAGLHVGAAQLEWLTLPTYADSPGRPLEVSLAHHVSAQESGARPSASAVRKASAAPVEQPVASPPRVKPAVRTAASAAPPRKPTVSHRIEPLSQSPKEACEAGTAAPDEPLPDRTRFDLLARLEEGPSPAPVKQLVATTLNETADLGGAAASRASSGKPRTPIAKGDVALEEAQPMYWDNPLPEYPLQARRRHWEGVVWLLVHVSAEGAVNELRLDRSSGYAVLDRSARQAVRRWKFLPARRAGLPVACQVRVPVRFELDKS